VHCRIAEEPKAFKITELAQIWRACGRLKFKNKKLHAALAANILALTDAELNPRAALNILCACHRIGFSDPAVVSCLVRTAHQAVTCHVETLEGQPNGSVDIARYNFVECHETGVYRAIFINGHVLRCLLGRTFHQQCMLFAWKGFLPTMHAPWSWCSLQDVKRACGGCI
jgi:hypothetical protein